MNAEAAIDAEPSSEVRIRSTITDGHRARLLAGLPVAERRTTFVDILTVVLEGGEGRPLDPGAGTTVR